MVLLNTLAWTLNDDLPVPAGARLPDMPDSYDSYISSGLYDRRYPRPNRRTLRRLLSCLPEDGCFLDFGAGTGRYTLPLLERTRARGVAYDICPSACRTLAERMEPYTRAGRLTVRGDTVAALDFDYRDTFDLVLLAFGVLGHVAGRAERQHILQVIRRTLKPGGALVLSLPNARRRFLAEQRDAELLVRAGELEPGDVLYARGQGKDRIEMFYHLYTLDEAREDLAAAGFEVALSEAESMLAEETAVRRPLLGRFDGMVCRFLPASLGYGFLIVGRP